MSLKTNINFGLYPGIFCCSNDHIIVIEGSSLKNKVLKHRYDFNYEYSNSTNKVKEIKLSVKNLTMSSRTRIISNFWEKTDSTILFAALPPEKTDKLSIYNFPI